MTGVEKVINSGDRPELLEVQDDLNDDSMEFVRDSKRALPVPEKEVFGVSAASSGSTISSSPVVSRKLLKHPTELSKIGFQISAIAMGCDILPYGNTS